MAGMAAPATWAGPGDFAVTGGNEGTDWSYASGCLTVTEGGTYTISMAPGLTFTTEQVVVAAGVRAELTLDGVSIDRSGAGAGSPLAVKPGAAVDLTLTGTNTLTAADSAAGIAVEVGTELTITAASTGSLAAVGGQRGAGIGGYRFAPAGDITINGGTIAATGGREAAGIGGGQYGAGGTVTVNGGHVSAVGGLNGAGIGGGLQGSGGTTTINGGTVAAEGNERSAGIGGGWYGGAGAVTVTGGAVTATSGLRTAGIGAGYDATTAGNVVISGGAVDAVGGDYGAGIGAAMSGAGVTIDISGGTVTATGGQVGVGIRTGSGMLTIGGGQVTAVGGAFAIGSASMSLTPARYAYWTNGVPQASGSDRFFYPADPAFAPANSIRYAKFDLAPVGSATVADAIITGVPGLTLPSGQTAVITLHDAVLSAAFTGHDIAGWFASLPTGLTASANGAAGSQTVTVSFAGTPTATATAPLALTVPGTALLGGQDLAVAPNPDARFDITTPYAVTLSVTSPYAFPGLTRGYDPGDATARPVLVTNTGTNPTGPLTVAMSGANPSAFALSSGSLNSIAASGDASFTVLPVAGLPSGAYTATVTVSGSNGIIASFDVSLTVADPGASAPKPEPTLAANSDLPLTGAPGAMPALWAALIALMSGLVLLRSSRSWGHR
jgi:hypothetical protein